MIKVNLNNIDSRLKDALFYAKAIIVYFTAAGEVK